MSLTFNGTTDFYSYRDPTFAFTLPVTIMAWVKFNTTMMGVSQEVMSVASESTSVVQSAINIYKNASDRIAILPRDGGGGTTVTDASTPNTIVANTWVPMVVQVAAGTLQSKLFLGDAGITPKLTWTTATSQTPVSLRWMLLGGVYPVTPTGRPSDTGNFGASNIAHVGVLNGTLTDVGLFNFLVSRWSVFKVAEDPDTYTGTWMFTPLNTALSGAASPSMVPAGAVGDQSFSGSTTPTYVDADPDTMVYPSVASISFLRRGNVSRPNLGRPLGP